MDAIPLETKIQMQVHEEKKYMRLDSWLIESKALNNPYGARGVPKCLHCRKLKQKVCLQNPWTPLH